MRLVVPLPPGDPVARAACLEDALAPLAEVAALETATTAEGGRMVVTLTGALDPALAAIDGVLPGARVQIQHPTRFGDSPDLSARLLALIASGAKTATCGALAHYHEDGAALPEPGQIMLALDHDDRPALVYEVTEVAVLPFRDIPEAFALAEGEGSFDDWRAGHIDYFTRNGGFDPAMPIVCERFRLIEVLASSLPKYSCDSPAGP